VATSTGSCIAPLTRCLACQCPDLRTIFARRFSSDVDLRKHHGFYYTCGMSSVNLDAMQAELHEAVDRIIDRYRDAAKSEQLGPDHPPVPTVDRPVIIKGDDISPWTYTWWGSGSAEEEYQPAREYQVVTPGRTHHVVLGWTQRPAWGRSDRGRAIVFWQSGSRTSNIFYPWTEFVETDTGRYAAPIPNPDSPRKILTGHYPLPPRFHSAEVQRSDQLFDQISNGPSLRLVVDGTDEESMIRHGYWVATLRNRFQ
jgi:hypothetical protein